MPIYQFKCNECGDIAEVQASIRFPTPNPPMCTKCSRVMVRKYSPFGMTPIMVEINSPAVGKHGSVRSYKTALDRHSDIHSHRVGREVKYESFDGRDPDQDPTKPLR